MRMTRTAAIFIAAVVLGTPASAQTFLGYPCTIDCSGHQAGYEWARQRSIASPYQCGGNSRSFIEGCQAYVEQQDDDWDSDNDDGDW